MRMQVLCIVGIFLNALLLSCDEKESTFTGGEEMVVEPPSALLIESDPDVVNADVYQFLISHEGNDVVRNTAINVMPSIFLNDSSSPIPNESQLNWEYSLGMQNSALGEFGEVQSRIVDLTEESGMIVLQGQFQRKADGFQGSSFLSVYVDATPPNTFLSDFGVNETGDRVAYWSTRDDYGVSEEHLFLFACERSTVIDLSIALSIAALPTECRIVLEGKQLINAGVEIIIPRQNINETEFSSADLDIYLYAEDLVGHFHSSQMKYNNGQQELILSSATDQMIATNKRSVTADLLLSLLDNGDQLLVSAGQNMTEWSGYDWEVVIDSDISVIPFAAQFSWNLQGAEGSHSLIVTAVKKDTAMRSNSLELNYLFDQSSPEIGDIKISIEGGALRKDVPVQVTWHADDNFGIKTQEIYLKLKDGQFEKIAELSGSERTHTFAWKETAEQSFEVRVVAADLATNIGIETSLPWIPQIFNAAVLTKSVTCFFCHLNIEGDVAGIDFPQSIHGASGQDLFISGSLYATGPIPSLLQGKASGGDAPSYANEQLLIFPKDTSGDGIPDFPQLTKSLLEPRVNGSLKTKDFSINRNHVGNIMVDGSNKNQPIQLNGEIYIDGDVIIKGYFTGIGTIYANNIFVVNDLIAMDSPFPFGSDPDQAIVNAREAIKEKKDGLYLGALGTLLVGDTDNKLNVPTSNPFQWISKVDFERLGVQADWLTDVNGANFEVTSSQIPDPTDTNNLRVNLEVNRVDAYLYSQNILVWRSYANFVLNGGFMAPQVSLVSTVPRALYLEKTDRTPPVNPRIGLPADNNVIRYDYRLRVGGSGFETVKEFFDQQ